MLDESVTPRVLVVDDHVALTEMLADSLGERGFAAIGASSGRDALRLLGQEPFDALVTDLRMPDVNGLEVLARSRMLAPERPVIVMTAHGAIDTAIESIRRGAYHYLTKPIVADELALFLSRALSARGIRRQEDVPLETVGEGFAGGLLVTRSASMRSVASLASRIAHASVPVLITGETGTGKSMLARAIHVGGPRATKRFVTINCAAMPEPLLESELFGHAKGAFTGATAARIGLFEEANGGTLLLDEIGEMSLPLQAKLLHTLESRAIRPIGTNREINVDVRIIAATHRDLEEMVQQQRFREDLLYRLNVVTIKVPALSQRREDIPELLDRFLAAARSRYPSSPVEGFALEVVARMTDCSWPGNVRQLEHLVERSVLLGRAAELTMVDLLPILPTHSAPVFSFTGPILPFREVQRRYVVWALEQLGGRKVATAERLGIDFKTLQRWLGEQS